MEEEVPPPSTLASALTFNLYNLLFNPDEQRRFLLTVEVELHRAELLSHGLDIMPSSVAFGNCREGGSPVKIMKQATIADIVYREDLEPDYSSLRFHISVINTNLSWAAHQHDTNILTWYVLCVFYASPRIVNKVKENTEAGLARWFFHEFENRFLSCLCGRVLASGKRGKTNNTAMFLPAYTPTQIVADFKLFFIELQDSKWVSYGGV
jgi:hypothetical protein